MTKPIRILAIGHSFVVAMNRAILRELARSGEFEITVAAPRFYCGDLRPLDLEPEPAGSALRVLGLSAYWTRWVHLFRYDQGELERLIADGEFDVVHAWEEPYVVSGFQVARALGKSSARFCFRTAQNNIKNYPLPFSYFEREVVRRAQAWIAGGHLVYDAMKEKGFPAAQGRVLTLGVDTTAFKPFTESQRSSVQSELGLRGPVVGFLGRLTKTKGVGVLLRAMERVDPKQEWSLFFIGSGPMEKRIRKWAADRGYSDRVRVRLLRHDEVPQFLPAVDLLVAPSQTSWNWREQFGRMTIEAFASGVPVIASDSGEIPRIVGAAGRIVSESDIRGWTRCIEELLSNSELRASFVTKGLERAELYSCRVIAPEYRRLYLELANRLTVPRPPRDVRSPRAHPNP